MRTLLLLPLLAACAPDPACATNLVTIDGTVTGAGTITVVLYDAATSTQITTAEADATGQYALQAPPGDYVVTAFASADEDTGIGGTTCYAPDVAVTLGCDPVKVDMTLSECETADKPNLYLYPSKDTPTTVRLLHDPRQVVFASAPPYDGGWEGTAHPDGTFTTKAGEEAPFLFYEITLLPAQGKALQRRDAVCVGGDDPVGELADLLGRYGFTDRERADFIAGWSDDLPKRSSYAVYPQRKVDGVVRLDVQPPLLTERLWLLIEDGAGCVPSNTPITPIARTGAHAVEWGVVLRGLR